MRYNHYNLSRNSAVSWGLKNEDKARSAFVAFMNSTHGHENVSCHTCGFQIYLDKPYLGASADGIGSCYCHEDRVVAIKCTYKHRDKTVYRSLRKNAIWAGFGKLWSMEVRGKGALGVYPLDGMMFFRFLFVNSKSSTTGTGSIFSRNVLSHSQARLVFDYRVRPSFTPTSILKSKAAT